MSSGRIDHMPRVILYFSALFRTIIHYILAGVWEDSSSSSFHNVLFAK